jgi:Family of unknown function (DUF5681)
MRKNLSKNRSGNYEVGKGRPPVETRWKSGQSGNSRGRPKRAKDRVSVFDDALNQKLTIQHKGSNRKVTVREGIVTNIIHQALNGDLKAIAFIIAREPEIARQANAAKEKITRHEPSPEEAERAYRRLIFGEKEE